jgi:hypothetical protein
VEQWIIEQNIKRFEGYLRLHFSPADRRKVETLLLTESEKLAVVQCAALAAAEWRLAS